MVALEAFVKVTTFRPLKHVHKVLEQWRQSFVVTAAIMMVGILMFLLPIVLIPLDCRYTYQCSVIIGQ